MIYSGTKTITIRTEPDNNNYCGLFYISKDTTECKFLDECSGYCLLYWVKLSTFKDDKYHYERCEGCLNEFKDEVKGGIK